MRLTPFTGACPATRRLRWSLSRSSLPSSGSGGCSSRTSRRGSACRRSRCSAPPGPATRCSSADPGATLVTATDGNHGRAVARMAAHFGVKATVFVPDVMLPRDGRSHRGRRGGGRAGGRRLRRRGAPGRGLRRRGSRAGRWFRTPPGPATSRCLPGLWRATRPCSTRSTASSVARRIWSRFRSGSDRWPRRWCAITGAQGRASERALRRARHARRARWRAWPPGGRPTVAHRSDGDGRAELRHHCPAPPGRYCATAATRRSPSATMTHSALSPTLSDSAFPPVPAARRRWRASAPA